NPSSDRRHNGCARGRDGEGKGRSSPLLPDFQGDPQFGHGARGGLERDASLNALPATRIRGAAQRGAKCRSFPRCPQMRRPSTFSPPIRKSTRIGRAFPRRSCVAPPRSRQPKESRSAPTLSSLNSCQYCYGGHRAAAELFGIAPQTIDGLIQDLATAPIDSKLRPILAFVKKLTLTSTRMTQADADAVFAAGGGAGGFPSRI